MTRVGGSISELFAFRCFFCDGSRLFMGLRSVVSVLYVSDSPGSIFFGREVGSRVKKIVRSWSLGPNRTSWSSTTNSYVNPKDPTEWGIMLGEQT